MHRAIVCSRSTYFKKVCDGNFKVCISSWSAAIPGNTTNNWFHQEAQQRKITFEEDEDTLIEQMLLYLYTMKYPQTSPSTNRTAQDMLIDARVYALADKYELVDLKTKAKRAFERLLAEHYDDALFRDAATLVYESTLQEDRGLREPLLDILWYNKATLLLKPGVQECIMAHEGFKNDVVESLFMDPGGSVEQQAVNVAATSSGSKKRRGGGRYFPRKRQAFSG